MWDKLKSFVVEDDAPKTVAPDPLAAAARPLGTSTAAPAQNNEFVTALRAAIKARPTAFTALLQSSDKLASVIPDPSMRLKAAYEMVRGDGRGINELLQAIEIHAQDLAQQQRQFDAASERKKTEVLATTQAELTNLGTGIDSARTQIAALTSQLQSLNQLISDNTVRQGELSQKIAAEEQHFVFAKQQFAAALSLVTSELSGQKAIISSTLS
jgi:predicted  nucleic acid-binding Zn-ribbon protein